MESAEKELKIDLDGCSAIGANDDELIFHEAKIM